MPTSHHLIDVFACLRGLCFTVLLSAAMPIHGQTIGGTPHMGCAINLTHDNANTTRFRLPEGTTSFVIPVASCDEQRCFTLENRDVAAKGTLSIATASRRLPVDDANWDVVTGPVRFQRKRQFYLSLVGVDAKFVRLTFHIDRLGKAAHTD